MKIATWNVNSIRVRIPQLTKWLSSAAPDVVCLQETKTVDDKFPEDALAACGYQCVHIGQKTYNGVALLARSDINIQETALPGDTDDEEARYVQAQVGGICIASLYLPNGNPVDGPKFSYKIAWMRRLVEHARRLLQHECPVVLCGDYNVCPTDDDTYDPEGFADDALCRIESRQLFREIINSGYTDALRVFSRSSGLFTYWDYQAGRWNKDDGLRIDHLLLSPEAADLLCDAGVDKEPRGWTKPSDHTPAWCELRSP